MSELYTFEMFAFLNVLSIYIIRRVLALGLIEYINKAVLSLDF